MPPTLEELREQRNQTAAQADEIAKRDDPTTAELDQAEELLTNVEEIDKRIKVLERNEAVRSRLAEPRPEPDLPSPELRDREQAQSDYDQAFQRWMRAGRDGLEGNQIRALQRGFVDLTEETRALGTTTGGAGGYTIPQAFQRKITEAMKSFGGMRQNANVITTESGATLPWPGNNDTGNLGTILDENTAMSDLDVVFTTNSLGAFMYVSGMVKVSYQLLQDTFFDLEAFLARKLGERIGRIQNRHFTIGVDTTQPQGLAVGGTSAFTAASATAVTIPELLALKQAVDPAYRDGGNSKWMFNDTTYGEIIGLLDADNRPLWQPDLTGAAPDRLFGHPVVINPDMPNTATGQKAIAFGDFRQGYIIRDVKGIQIQRLTERYAEFLQVAFFAYARADGGVDDASAFRLITMA